MDTSRRKRHGFNGFMISYITFGCTIFFGWIFTRYFRWPGSSSHDFARDRNWRKGLQFIRLRQALLQVLVDLAIKLFSLHGLPISSVISPRF
jgi:hypothetical protein